MTQIVKLSAETLNILKTCSSINKSLAFSAGNEIKVVSVSGNIIMEAVVPETFPKDFAVYELNKLLGVLALPAFKDAELWFDEEDDTHMVIKAGSSKIKYYFTAEDFVKHPGKSITLPKVDVKFLLSKDVLENFEKAAAALGHKAMKIKVADKNLFLIATSAADDTSNDYIVDLGDNEAEDFEASIGLEHLKLVPGDFTVELLRKGERGISKFSHLTRKINTFVSLDVQ